MLDPNQRNPIESEIFTNLQTRRLANELFQNKSVQFYRRKWRRRIQNFKEAIKVRRFI